MEGTSGPSGELQRSNSTGGVQNLPPGSARKSSKNSSNDGGRNTKSAPELVDLSVEELTRKLKGSGISEGVLREKFNAVQ